MRTTGNTILITGGGTGIGFALAEALSEAGNEVLICGRRTERLDEAKRQLPKVHALPCDVADSGGMQALFDWATRYFPSLNVLVNNAGIQRQIDFRTGARDLLGGEDEIVNISSGLGFAPLAFMPVY